MRICEIIEILRCTRMLWSATVSERRERSNRLYVNPLRRRLARRGRQRICTTSTWFRNAEKYPHRILIQTDWYAACPYGFFPFGFAALFGPCWRSHCLNILIQNTDCKSKPTQPIAYFGYLLGTEKSKPTHLA